MYRCMPGALWNWHFIMRPLDHETCVARFALGCPEALARPGAPSLDELEGCAETVGAASCKEVFDAQRFGDRTVTRPLTVPVAVGMCGVRGTRADGEACESSLECAGGVCLGAEQQACGTCASVRTPGSLCEWPEPECSAGHYCGAVWDCPDPPLGCSVVESRCFPLAGEGEACPTFAESSGWQTVGCDLGLHCVNEVCVRASAEGEPCDIDAGETPRERWCDDFQGLLCDPSTLTCKLERPEPTNLCFYTPDGAPCMRGFDSSRCEPPCLYPTFEVFDSTGGHCERPPVCTD
jgi:hypothetical protein